MKNRIRKMLLLVCAATAALLITACGGSSDNAASDDTTQAEDTADDAAAEEDAAADDSADEAFTGKYASIQEFIDSDMMQESLQQQISSLEGTGMSMTITGEDNKLVYNFTFDDPELSTAIAADVSQLESSLDSQASTFESVAGILPAAIDVENPVVVVRYLGSDGTELISREFAPSDDSAADTATE